MQTFALFCRLAYTLLELEDDQLKAFQERDSVSFSELKEVLLSGVRSRPVSVIAFMDEDVLTV